MISAPTAPGAPSPGRTWLIGLMASGKSTIGALLTADASAPYVDNDATIASLAGRSTVDLAAAGGDLLHDWEDRYVRRVVRIPPPVVAGIPASIAERSDDLALLAASGLLVYLRADLDTLIGRIRADPPRPWLTGDPRHLLVAMLERRDPLLVAAASVVVDATRPPAEVADAVRAAGRERVRGMV